MAEQQDPENNPADKPAVDHDLRITFQDAGGRHSSDAVPRRLSRATNRSRSGSRSRVRSRSRASSHDRLPPASPYSGVQIEYRTLSIHVSESRQVGPDSSDKKPTSAELKDKKQADEDYFASLTYHELSKDQVCQQLNVAEGQGLSDRAASVRLERDGKNVLPHPKTNYFKKVFWYVFGGFCSVLWVGVIVFFLCWRPLSSPPSVTNLALAILVLIVISLQATFNAFQDWSTQRTMKSILDLLPAETRVWRNGVLVSLPSTELVAGDIVHLTSKSFYR
jgi:sodium/potassium-transporting ATPase subunit alpha